MPTFYPYLISSLPMLHFGMRPPFSGQRFLEYCRQFISQSDATALKKTSLNGEYTDQEIHPTLKEWQDFDTLLRNELVKIRASHLHLDPNKHLRGSGYVQPYVTHIALGAHRTPSLLEAEKALDQERWRFLEALSFGHYFDLDFLLIYFLKLLILERWERQNSADKERVLTEALVS